MSSRKRWGYRDRPECMDLRARFSANLAHWRVIRGMSQSQLAREVRVTSSAICRLETIGVVAPSFDLLAALALALEIEPAELLAEL